MTQNATKFHIIVPVYKAERYLDDCVQSVLSQSYQNFELILVDDGSPDRCGEICDAWAAKDSRIYVIHNENGGVFRARCTAIAYAQKTSVSEQDYAIFLDSDDTLQPDTLEVMAERIRQYGCDCLIFNAIQVLEGKGLNPVYSCITEPRVITDKRELYDAVLKDGCYIALWRKTVRLNCLGTWDFSPWYHISRGEDVIHSLEIYQNCSRIAFVPDMLYRYRLNPAGLTMTNPLQGIFVDYEYQNVERCFLEHETVYAGAPMVAYRDVQIRTFSDNLVTISRRDIPRGDKIAMFKRIRQTPYWKEFINGGYYNRVAVGKNALVYELFRRKQDSLLLLLIHLYIRCMKLRSRYVLMQSRK